jgi:hypothetical protein
MPAIDEQELHGTYQGVSFHASALMTLTKPPAGPPNAAEVIGRANLSSREPVG